MVKALDLIGRKFNRLTVIEKACPEEKGKSRWICKCDCGNYTVVEGTHLRKGNIKSCGCLRFERLKDMTGQRFGRLLVLGRAENNWRNLARWKCRCDCGNIVIVDGANLRSGFSKSCGCISKEKTIQRSTKHGHAKRKESERLHRVWHGMIERCYYDKHSSYQYYGARGIVVCEEWRNNYTAFRAWALANGYNDIAKRGECTLDRVDVNGNYCPENCRWVSMAVQNKNRRGA